jgi:hypothetical protein
MVCSENDTSINITIPVVMIPKSAGKELTESLATGAKGTCFSYFTFGFVEILFLPLFEG